MDIEKKGIPEAVVGARMGLCRGARVTEHIGLLARMSVLDTEVDGSNPSISMLFP